jgi:cellulose synthase/poly-beta-1,6-N-acetylglucosamine synthase-like glycosyltransferase
MLRLIAVGFLLWVVANPVGAAISVISIATAVYLAALFYRLRIFWAALNAPASVRVTDERAKAVWDRTLPTYTVLVPAFGEPEVIGQLVAAINALDYPRDRLDVKLLLEEDDLPTIRAAREALADAMADHIQICLVPYSEPRTKPKACNYGLAQARGRHVTVYDAEDRPEPLQLRRAVLAFRAADESVACLQAKLSYYNPQQNSITRWFTVEYAMWFSQLLPGLMLGSAPLPLGGTSNHFRRSVLDQVGGWDPYNVTEDADLGIRLHRLGYRTRVLESTTLEEANSDFINWVKQRSRWYKGYMQTWLVHMRHPRALLRDLGPGGFAQFSLFVGGTPLLAILNPLFWALTGLWIVGQREAISQLFPPWLYYGGLLSLTLGNAAFVYLAMAAAREAGSPRLVIASVLTPLYWIMMSIAAIKAVLQLATAPSFWEKTIHGLDRKAPVEAIDGT